MGKTRIRALILDYGGVISKPQSSESVNNMLKILGRDDNDVRDVYRSQRENYDNGQLSGVEYWHNIIQTLGLELNESQISNLIREDIKSWIQINDSMIGFIKESREKLHTLAIISNMTRDTLAYMKKHFQWLELFDELTYSCDIGVNKPDKRIYEACLCRLELPPRECLFVDDSAENVYGAIKSGMEAIHFKSFFQFRQELEKNFRLCQ